MALALRFRKQSDGRGEHCEFVLFPSAFFIVPLFGVCVARDRNATLTRHYTGDVTRFPRADAREDGLVLIGKVRILMVYPPFEAAMTSRYRCAATAAR
ncbi:hypothetical protein [Paraburkholderia bannensis]|uniref:hypothetical protein n=1 Tax=Paraburkholderia bannensis TaxID=765414 RepID=UPI002ABD8AA1|nr:hypothetical protein [Paraburkholderia bannensis]